MIVVQRVALPPVKWERSFGRLELTRPCGPNIIIDLSAAGIAVIAVAGDGVAEELCVINYECGEAAAFLGVVDAIADQSDEVVRLREALATAERKGRDEGYAAAMWDVHNADRTEG